MDQATTTKIITDQIIHTISTNSTEQDNGEMKDLLIAKVTAMIVLGVVSFILGMLPHKLAKWFHWEMRNSETNGNNLIISLLLCFGGGVLMFTTFLHLQPEVREGIESLLNTGFIPEVGHKLNLAELIFCIGFFFVYLIEEVVHSILDHRHGHNEEEAILHRTMSLRRCSRHPNTPSEENPTLIPRVSLTQDKQLENNTKSTSTQILLDSSSLSTVDAFQSKYSMLDPELHNVCYTKEKEYEGFDDKLYQNKPKTGQFEDDLDSSTTNQTVDNLSKSFRGFLAILALSFHAIFEGLAVGLEMSVQNVWYLFLAVATHKFVLSFCVGVELMTNRTKLLLNIVYLATFAIVSPLGIGIGIALYDTSSSPAMQLTTLVLQGMAAGTLLYVVFFEVLQRERANSQSGILQLIAIIAGFGVMFGLQMIAGHEHSHGEEEDDDHKHNHYEVHYEPPTSIENLTAQILHKVFKN